MVAKKEIKRMRFIFRPGKFLAVFKRNRWLLSAKGVNVAVVHGIGFMDENEMLIVQLTEPKPERAGNRVSLNNAHFHHIKNRYLHFHTDAHDLFYPDGYKNVVPEVKPHKTFFAAGNVFVFHSS